MEKRSINLIKIIALQGKSNVGKTTVITKLYQKLCSAYKRVAYYVENHDGDFSAIFDINKHIIGVTSIGDRKKDLLHPFEFFDYYNCELVVVCCHKLLGNGQETAAVIEDDDNIANGHLTDNGQKSCQTKGYSAKKGIREIVDPDTG